MSVSDVCWLIFLGVVCTSVAFLVNIEIVKKLGVFTVSLSINLEPIYTIILAVILLNENELLSYKFYVGASIIILVLIINALIKNRNGRKNLQLNISEKDY
jgi:drug/metabolite transporter (DMT)-like permease